MKTIFSLYVEIEPAIVTFTDLVVVLKSGFLNLCAFLTRKENIQK